jgi:hypothetical protein
MLCRSHPDRIAATESSDGCPNFVSRRAGEAIELHDDVERISLAGGQTISFRRAHQERNSPVGQPQLRRVDPNRN